MNKSKRFFRNAGVALLAAAILLPVGACAVPRYNDGEPYEPPEPWHEDSVDTITMFCNDWEQFNSAAEAKSDIYKVLTNKIGVGLKARSTSLETYYTQLDLQRTQGKLDELFIIPGPPSSELYNGLIRDREIIPITYYVNEETKDEYPYLYEYLKEFEYMKTNVAYAQGEIWFVPVKLDNDKSLYVRRDWVRNLNNKLDDILVQEGVVGSKGEITEEIRAEYRFSEEGPKDLGEFYRLARAFTKYDPDGNGKDDTYGYVTETNRDMDSWLHVAFDSPWKSWTADADGVYHNTATSEGSKLATAFLNKLVSEGIVNLEDGTKGREQKEGAFTSGKAGMMYAHNWYNVILANYMSTLGITGADAIELASDRILICDPPAGKTGHFGGQSNSNYYRGWCIREGMSEERRKACLDLLEYLHSPEGVELITYGVERTHWEWTDETRTKRRTLREPDPQGFLQELRWTDSAAFAGYLTYLPPESKALLTNGDILVERDQKTAATMVLPDYPDLYTDSMMKHQEGAYDFFDTKVLSAFIDKSLAADWTYNAKTWKTDWKTALYTASAAMDSYWNKFVSDYNGSYYGSTMEKEYNAYITEHGLEKYVPSK